ncbi:unnamed protein product [Lactuca virosa]|uniref:Uncharacterized protein n=1 Tax=Lactuca virosa TaxID=75947 RepID=A0AAU9N6Q3_9ASTR|nr:unnamed protein product [Lactuca virosa]
MEPCDAYGASDLTVAAAGCLVDVCLTKQMDEGGWSGVLRRQWVASPTDGSSCFGYHNPYRIPCQDLKKRRSERESRSRPSML